MGKFCHIFFPSFLNGPTASIYIYKWRPFSVIWPLVTFREIFTSGHTGSNDTGLRSPWCPEAEPIKFKTNKQILNNITQIKILLNEWKWKVWVVLNVYCTIDQNFRSYSFGNFPLWVRLCSFRIELNFFKSYSTGQTKSKFLDGKCLQIKYIKIKG
jgi:hypothetical protein